MDDSDFQKHSSFIKLQIGSEIFAIGVEKILEIIQFDKIFRIPDAPDFLKGVINYRNTVVPVIDMFKRFNINSEVKDHNMAIVVNLQKEDRSVTMGLLVDQVIGIVDFREGAIHGIGDFGFQFNADFIIGIAEQDGQSMPVLNVNNLLNNSEIVVVEENPELTPDDQNS